jgi:hypothetical protein
MEALIVTSAVLTAVVIGIVEVVKKAGLNKKWLPLIAIITGVLLTLCLALFQVTTTVIITGLAIGLSAVGLFSSVKNTLGK